jgi:cytochrome c553
VLNILPFISALFFLSCSQSVEKKAELKETPKKVEMPSLQKLEEEYAAIDTIPYLEAYIERIIMVGSSGLGFASGEMQGGFAEVSDAEKIAHYVVTLSGKDCSDHEMAKKAQMYYTSNCGGCHGDDGKGQNGTFPDLTKSTLQGIEKRKEYLKYEIEKLKK